MYCITLGALIYRAVSPTAQGSADVAIILGAAVTGDKPSPVFEERIKHGIGLYKAGRVKFLIFTGGYGEGKKYSEAGVGRAYAIQSGVPTDAILIEDRSRTTLQNLEEAAPLLATAKARTAFIVSDPLHMFRAMQMASGLGISAEPSPTPTTRYRSFNTKADFLIREIYFSTVYFVVGK